MAALLEQMKEAIIDGDPGTAQVPEAPVDRVGPRGRLARARGARGAVITSYSIHYTKLYEA